MDRTSENWWNRFWFAPASTQSLCLFRAFFGTVFFIKMIGLTNLQRLGHLAAEFPTHRFNHVRNFFIAEFRMPVPGTEWFPVPSFEWYQRLEVMLMFAAAFFAVGLFTRASGLFIAVVYLYFFLLSQFNYRHHIQVLVTVFLVLALSKCSDHYSIDAYLRGPAHPRPKRPILPVRLIQVMVTILYFFSTSMKLNEGWFTGKVMYVYYHQGSLAGDIVDWADSLFMNAAWAPYHEDFWRAVGFGLAWFTILVEGFLVLGLWFRRTRPWAIWFGFVLHLGIDMTMRVNSFSIQMWVLYILFIQPQSGRTVVLYDGTCPLCQRSTRWCNLLDWLRRVSWVNFRNLEIRGQVPYLSDEQLDAEMFVITPEGRVYSGYDAWRRLSLLFPLTFPLAFLLYIPPIPQIGRAVYSWIAKHRYQWFHCTDDTCRIDLQPPGPSPYNEEGWRATLAAAGERNTTD
ncbi:MAG: DCC1-like thiol-disulfide oxidoreductase family protein [Pirellulales bacterium]|nr:DCC1-like thiol-disulfide oxidoreductase family protein [Pirellulales bacterium]